MVSGTSSPLHGYKEKRSFPFLSLSSLSPSLSLSVTMATSLLFGFVFWWREQLMLEQTGHSKPLPLSLSSSSCTWDKGRRKGGGKEEGESKFTSHSKLTLTTGLRCNRRLGTSFLFLRMKTWKLSYSAKPHTPPPQSSQSPKGRSPQL